MDPQDVIAWVASAIALVGLFFAGWQLRLLRAQQDREREIEQRGVAVMWRAQDVPTTADPDGSSASSYEFTVYNPGKLPVRDVVVNVALPIEVQRAQELDPVLRTPDLRRESPRRGVLDACTQAC